MLAERVASDSQTVFVILNCHAMNFQHLLVSQGLFYSLQAFGQIHASPNMCFPLQHVFASSFGLGLSDANAKARAVIPVLRKFTVARLLEPHCKLWTWADLGGLGRTWADLGGLGRTWADLGGLGRTWADLGGLGRTGAVPHDSDLLGPICISSESGRCG